MSKFKRTIKAYVDLFRNPRALFPPSAASNGVETVIYPNGQREIWFSDVHNGIQRGIRLTVGSGPYGLGIHIDTFAGTAPVSVMSTNGNHIELCQYDPLPRAQAFKEAYQAGDLDTFYKTTEGK